MLNYISLTITLCGIVALVVLIKLKETKAISNHNVKRILYIIICICLIFCTFTTFAHSGRTDSNGGHWDHSKGTYHYHTGEHAGRTYTNNKSSSSHTGDRFVIFLLVSPFLFTFCSLFYLWLSESLPKNIILNFENNLRNYHNEEENLELCYKQLLEIKEKATIPNGYTIGTDNLPKEDNSPDWGKSLTVYTAHNGKKLHIKEDCCKNILYAGHIYNYQNKRYSLCKICALNYQFPDLNWYVEYLKIPSKEQECEVILEKQNIALHKLHECYNKCNTKTSNFFLFFSSSKKKKVNKLKNEYEQLLTTL